MIVIYGLICPTSGQIRYIGKTAQKLPRRLNAHISDALRNQHSHKQRWIKKCLDSGARPLIQILEEVSAGKKWQDCERAWIQKSRASGIDLTNQTAGGEGLDFIDPEADAKYRRNQSVASKKIFANDPSILEGLRQANRISWATNREARLAACRAGTSTEEAKRNLAEAMAQVRARPEYSAAKSKGQKKAWANHRAMMMEAFSNPEMKAKQSQAKRKTWADPEGRARMMNRWTPEARAIQAQLIRERQALIQSRMTPEVRAKQGAKLKETWAKRKAAIA